MTRIVTFGTLNPDGKLSAVRQINQSDILACPHAIMVAEHYRDDGSCKCNDPAEQKRMIAEWGYTEQDFKLDAANDDMLDASNAGYFPDPRD